MKKDYKQELTLERLKNHKQELIDILDLLQNKCPIIRHGDNPYDYAFCCGQQSVIHEIRSLIE